MKKLAILVAALLLAATFVTADDQTRQYTRPAVPSSDALDRLNLKMAWRTYVPTDGKRDSLIGAYVLPGQLLVQTRSGLVIALDPETGQQQWRTMVGQPYQLVRGLTHNSQSVFAISTGTVLFALDRRTGDVQWQYELPNGVAAFPVADEELLFISLGIGRLFAYALPRPVQLAGDKTGKETVKKPEKVADKAPSFYGGSSVTTASIGPLSSSRDAYRDASTGPRPVPLWDYRTIGRLEKSPLVSGNVVVFADTDGRVIGLNREDRTEQWSFLTEKEISAPVSQYGELVYIASKDANLYAVRIPTGRQLWRFASGSIMLHKPVVTEEDVFVVPESEGLYRLSRTTGDTVWQNKQATRFLALNPKFVYATDRHGRLLVLDRARGTQLSVYDGTRDYVFPVSNEMTDRVYLAANDGLIVCLHDRQFSKPLRNKEGEEPKPSSGNGKKGDGMDKPKDKGGEMEKPKDKGGEMEKK